MKSRVLNIVLSVVLAAGLLPVSAYADEPDATSESSEIVLQEETLETQSLDADEAILETLDAPNLTGSGTAEDPYLIGSAADLADFRDYVNTAASDTDAARTVCATLRADIVLSGEWTPISNIGYVAQQYGGIFDGAGHTISGLSINSDLANQGLFGTANGATIKNLKVEGSVISSKSYIGGIVGKVQAGTTIQNCSMSGSVTTTYSTGYAGGLVGGVNTANGLTVDQCVNNASVTGATAGGIMGYSNKAVAVSNCYNTGAITGTSRAGGIVGQLNSGTIANCFNVGEVSCTASAGGIYSFSNATVSNCYYTQPAAANNLGGTATDGTHVDEITAAMMGSAFVDGAEYPALAWEGTTPVAPASKATVSFAVTPADAAIVFDGKELANGTARVVAGTYDYTVSAAGYTAQTSSVTVTTAQAEAGDTVPVTVDLQAKTLTNISVAGAPNEAFVGDAAPALTVTATYDDNSTETVVDFTTDWATQAASAGEKTITVTYGGLTATFACTFSVKAGPTAGLTGKADVNLKVGSYGWEEVQLAGETVLASTNKGKNSSSSSMTVTATQAGMLSFEWKISSEARYDYLDIAINGTSINSGARGDYSGTIDWTTYSKLVSAGDVITINYTKDTSGNTGEDTAWLRNFQLAPAYTITLTTVPAGATVVLKDAENNTVTGTNGVYTVVAGTYTYTASAFGYDSATDTITVTDVDVTEAITLTQQAGQTVTFNVTTPEGITGTPVVEVKAGGETAAANPDGTFTLPAGNYTYTVTCEGCDPVESTFTVANTAVTVDVDLPVMWTIEAYFAGMALTPVNGTYGFVRANDEAGALKSNNAKMGGSTATLTLTATQAGLLSFSYKVSSETNYDKFNVKVNGVVAVSDKSGEVGWTSETILVAAGDKIAFSYSKDGSSDKNGDAAWLKDFSMAPAYTVTPSIPEGATLVLISNGATVAPSANGTYTLVPGTYSYTVSQFGHESVSGTLNVVDTDTSITVESLTLLPTAIISFDIPGSANVAVSHANAGVMTAEADGSYVLPLGEAFSYTVTQENYITVNGSFVVSGNATITVELVYAGVAWDGTSKTEPSQVDGVYQIFNAEELAWFADYVKNTDNAANAVLAGPINLADKSWVSMGKYNSSNYQTEYAGTFDGAGFTITGLKGSNGLFNALAADGVVKNLNVNGTISGSGNIGGIAGSNYGLIENCSMSGSVSNSVTYSTGGIAGRCPNGSAGIKNCANFATVATTSNSSSTVNVGGIVGYTYSPVLNCYNTGSISCGNAAAQNIGGLVGNAYATATMENCYNVGTVKATATAKAIAGNYTPGSVATNCYYLDTCGVVDPNAQAKTRAELAEPSFVASLNGAEGAAWNKDTAGINGGMPVLAWQGGEPCVDQDAADVAAVKAALALEAFVAPGQLGQLVAGDDGVYEITADDAVALALNPEGDNSVTIAWTSSKPAFVTSEGGLTWPESGFETVVLTATLTKGAATDTKEFTVRLLSEAEVNQRAVNALAARLGGQSMWAQEIVNPDVETAADAVIAYAEARGIDLNGATITFVPAGEKTYPDTADVNIANDGAITYFQGVEGDNSAKYALYNNVTFQVTKGGATATFTDRLFISWDRERVQEILNVAAASEALSWNSIKPASVTNAAVAYNDGEDLTSAANVIFNDVDCTDAPIADGTVFLLPTQLGAMTVKWGAVYDTKMGELVKFEEAYVDSTLYTRATIQGSKRSAQEVMLTATLTYNLLNDGEAVFSDGENTYPTVYGAALYNFTIAQGELIPVDSEATLAALDEKYEGLITTFVGHNPVDLDEVTENLHMPTPSDLEKAGILLDRENESVQMTSANEDVLSFYGYQAQVFRPLPDQDAVTVDYTVTIKDYVTKDVIAEKTFKMTVAPLTQDELDEAAEFMALTATPEVYWEGLAYEGADKNNITQSLRPFSEVVMGEDGQLQYLRGAVNITFGGLQLDDLPGYDSMNAQPWREIRSSNESVLTSEQLLYTQPQFDTEVTLDSCMTYTTYAQYWEKFGLSEEATDESRAAYAAFEQFYKKPVSVTVLVPGTDGPEPEPEPADDVNVTFTMSLAGQLATTKDGAFVANLPVVAKDLDENGTITYDEALVAAHTAYAPNGADDYVGGSWVKKLWGSTAGVGGFAKNNALTDVVNKVTVVEGDNLYAYTFADAAGWSDTFAYFTASAASVSADEPLELTLMGISYDADYNLVVNPVAGAQLGCVTEEGFVPFEGSKTAADGKVTVKFDRGGTYLITAQVAGKIITAPVCVVDVDGPLFEVAEKPFAGSYYKVTWFGGAEKGTTPVACGVEFLVEPDYTFIGLLTAEQVATLTNESFTFEDKRPEMLGALMGDVNNNGVVNIVDAQLAYDVAVNRISNFDSLSMAGWFTADVNNSGYVDASDALVAQRIAILGSAE